MSLKSASRELAERALPESAMVWLRRVSATLRSMLQAVTTPYYRGAVTGAAVALVTLGLLLILHPGPSRQPPPVAPLAASLPLQASNGQAASTGPGQGNPGQARGAGPGQAPNVWTPAMGPVASLYPQVQPSP